VELRAKHGFLVVVFGCLEVEDGVDEDDDHGEFFGGVG